MTYSNVKDFDVRVDVVPVVSARPILTPPRPGQALDDPLYAYLNPYTGKVELITDLLTIFPYTIKTPDGPLILSLGMSIFVGIHLFKGYPKLPERLLDVLGRAFQDDKALGVEHRWIDSRPVRSSWRKPAPTDTTELFSHLRRKPVA